MSWVDPKEAKAVAKAERRRKKVQFQPPTIEESDQEGTSGQEATSGQEPEDRDGAQDQTVGDSDSNTLPADNSSGGSNRRVTFSDLVVNVQEKKKGRRLTLTPIMADADSFPGALFPLELPPTWREEREVLISCVKFSLGLINLWRFPFLAYTNQGGAFVICYLIVTVLVGVPIYYLELILSQYSGLDTATIWAFCSFFRGLGPCVFFVCLITIVYYNVILAYALLYMLHCLRKHVPWEKCFDWWGANVHCFDSTKVVCRKVNQSYENFNETKLNCTNATESASENFWRVYSLNLSDGIDDPGRIQWRLAACLLIIWILTASLLFRRVYMKTVPYSYEISCSIVVFSYSVLLVFFCYGFFFEGASAGLNALIWPNLVHLKDLKIWALAATQNLFSLGVGMGGLIRIGNKNNFHHKIHGDSVVASLVTSLTSVISAVIVFCSLGHMADKLGLSFFELNNSGQCLALIAYSEATLQTWRPRVAALCFYSMLILISIDTSVDLTHVILNGLEHTFPLIAKHNFVTIPCVSLALFAIGLSFTTQGGIYLLNVFDTFGGIAILGTTLFEVIAFAWAYGVKSRVMDSLGTMTGMQPSYYMQACWLVLAPMTLAILFVDTWFESPLSSLFGVKYPKWVYFFGWLLTAVPLIQVPIWMIISLFEHKENLKETFQPTQRWGSVIAPQEPQERLVSDAFIESMGQPRRGRRKSIIKKTDHLV